MSSLYQTLNEKIAAAPKGRKKPLSLFDLTLLLFNARAELAALWEASHAVGVSPDPDRLETLKQRVDALRPLFGERP